MRTEVREERAGVPLVSWRMEQLLASGFSSRLAGRVARETCYDLHALIELVESGCPPELAVRILAP
jgi:hypothetical protein